VFDGPSLKGDFQTRITKLKLMFKDLKNPYLEVLKHIKVRNNDHLNQMMDSVLKKGGEGMILRDPKEGYHYTWHVAVLKVKKFHDAEATIIGIHKGQGRLLGMMGALICKTKEGVEFKVGSGFTDKERRKPPKIGTKVTY